MHDVRRLLTRQQVLTIPNAMSAFRIVLIPFFIWAYVEDEYGDIWNTYHARPGVDGVRSSGIRRVHFDVDGAPRLDMTEELDVNPELKKVKLTLKVK